MLNKIKKFSINKMNKCINLFIQEINQIRTNKVFPELLDKIYINYYNNKTPLSQIANITVEGTSMLKINSFDSSINKEIEKTILKANLGFSCSIKGKNIYVIVPQLTEERRKELVKVIKTIAQKFRVYIRNIRRESNLKSKEYLKNNLINKDEDYKFHSIIQNLTNDHIKKIDELLLKKENLLLNI